MALLSKRIPTILALLLLFAGLGFGGWYLITNRPVVVEGERPKNVRITNVADNKFTVSWTTTESTQGAVEWGEVGQKLNKMGVDDRDSAGSSGKYLTHHVTVSELQPETSYAFRILSGEQKTRFDNNGAPYSLTTGPTIAVTPVAVSFYGQVETEAGQPSGGAIIYITVPGAAPISVLTKASGSYSTSLTTIRTSDLSEYVAHDPKATVISILATDGKKESNVSVSTTNAAPVPTIVMGKTHDFRTQAEAVVAEVTPTGEAIAETPTVFNVEPLGEVPDSGGQVVLLNPAEEGEQVATTQPEFFGIGPAATVISITVQSTTPYSDTLVVDEFGEWSWSPPADLTPGEHTVTIAYVDLAGIEQVLSRTFTVAPAMAQSVAFEATPSGSTTTKSPSPTPKPSPLASSSSQFETSPSPSPIVYASVREGLPSTESGVPVSGVMAPTVLTALMGFAIVVIGALLLAL